MCTSLSVARGPSDTWLLITSFACTGAEFAADKPVKFAQEKFELENETIMRRKNDETAPTAVCRQEHLNKIKSNIWRHHKGLTAKNDTLKTKILSTMPGWMITNSEMRGMIHLYPFELICTIQINFNSVA